MKRLSSGFIAAILIILWAYGQFIEPQWVTIQHLQLVTKDNHQKMVLALLSDLHLKEIGRRERKTLDALKEAKPQVIVLSGDIIDQQQSLNALDLYLSSLPNAIIVATLGNWEHWSSIDLNTLRRTYKKHGVSLLVNECLPGTTTQLPYNFIGLDDFTGGHPDLKKAMAMCQDGLPHIVVEHSPQFFNISDQSFNNADIRLNLAGHTHGGQVALLGHPLVTPPGSGNFVSGWYDTAYGELYVTSGIGTSILPIRLGVRPSIALFEIQ